MRHATRMAGALLAAALLAGAAGAQALGPGGAVIVPVTPAPGATFVGPGQGSPDRFAVEPRRVVTARGGRILVPAARTTFDVRTPPPGYRRAFEDGRDNPLRGPRTLQGDYQTDGIWTRDVPRELRPIIRVRR